MSKPKDVFISHSSKDLAVAMKICELLEKRGVSCWIAPRDVTPGKNYAQDILEAIETTQATVLILSEFANQSDHVLKEIERAVHYAKTIFPIRIREVLPSKKLELFISTEHWIDAWKPPIEGNVDRLTEAIKLLLKLKSDPPDKHEPDGHNNKDSLVRRIKQYISQRGFKVVITISITMGVMLLIFLKPYSPEYFQPDFTQEHVTITELNTTYSSLKEQVDNMPLAIPALKDSLKPLAERTLADQTIRNEAPRAVAKIYRLYSAAMLLAANGDMEKIREGVIWSRRALDLDSTWSDKKELSESIQFFQSILDKNISQTDLRKMLFDAFRIGMVEADTAHVDQAADQAYNVILTIMRGTKDAPMK